MKRLSPVLASVACAAGVAVSAQQKPADTGLEVIQIRPQFYVIPGGGSNVAVQLGPAAAPAAGPTPSSRQP